MAYKNPYHADRHVHHELAELTELLGIDAKAEAAARLEEVRESADAAWASDPVAIEFGKVQDARDQNSQRRSELNALIAAEERKAKEAARTGSYIDSRDADSRLKELREELSFCNSRGTTLGNELDRFQRKADRVYQDVYRRFSSNIRRQCESEHTAKLAELLELIRSQPAVMKLVTDIAVADAVHVQFLP